MTAQQLKNSILQMAVQGKLVPQDKNDEPASVLLERIKAEKQELIKADKIKKDKKSSEIFRGASRNLPYAFCEQTGKEIRDISDEIPFEIPDSWGWVRLGELCDIINGFTPLRSKEEFWNSKDIPWFTVEDIRLQGREITETKQFISKLAVSDNSNRILPVNSILLCCTASVGEYAIAKIPLTTNQQFNGLAIKEEYKELFYYRFLYHIASTFKDTLIRMAGKTTFNFISVKKVSSILIPFPPFNEQHRIVAKIEELLPYIERYGKAEEHLTELNTKFPEALKKSILQEAVQGKLVPQNPDDEPASVLLERIKAEKQKLIKEGKIKKEKPLAPITEEEIPFDIPESWEWCRLGGISWYFDAGKSPNCIKQCVTGDEYGVITTTSIQIGYFDEQQNKVLPPNFDVKEEMKVKKGDILITRAGPMNRTGVACVVKDIHYNLILSDKTIRINMSDEFFDKDYIVTVINSPKIREQIVGLMSGMDKQQVNISQDKYKTVFIPIPPLEEQKRIVAKIEELTKYCDKL